MKSADVGYLQTTWQAFLKSKVQSRKKESKAPVFVPERTAGCDETTDPVFMLKTAVLACIGFREY